MTYFNLYCRNETSVNDPRQIIQSTHSLLRCFLFFDTCWIISAAFLVIWSIWLNSNVNPQLITLGGLMGIYSLISAFVNSLARYGVKSWTRGLLIPWLGFYMMIFIVLTANLLESLMSSRDPFQWHHIFLILASFAAFCCWQHMYKQYNLMMTPRSQAK